ncbi:PAS domain S-box protein [Natrarchaeobaculum sulfurireducens]|uniref:Sensory box histidine kinase n=1 Tax=Natrarchaeobaculum sulfurireducens TaxID=2044521 RepID=A0A346PD62_9EURY|nr:PAS domain S-box protein [Natrarchaeobaculum sulfurireducens]AXR77457.1 Signal transduction histidine kinase with PAS domain [Natrarchaeobaculum sulfurireducens]AXR82572.1 Sensory box histidine kinase [Natrarchaeobaculum sulfurireducens]
MSGKANLEPKRDTPPSRHPDPFFGEEIATGIGGLVCLDTTGTIVFAGPYVGELVGYDPDELFGRPLVDLFADDRDDPLEQFLEQGRSRPKHQDDTLSGGALECTHSLVHGDGRLVPVTLAVDEVEHDGRRLLIVRLRNRTELEADRRYDGVVNTVADGIYYLDSEGRFVAVNDRIVEATGYERDYLLGEHVSVLLDDETIERTEHRIRELMRTGGESVTLDLDVTTATGEQLPCELRLSVLERHGEFVGTVGVVRDVTDRLERERAVEHRSAVIESAIDGMGFSDETGELCYVNPALAELHGYDEPEALVGTSWKVLFPEEEADRIEREILPIVLERGYWRGEATGKRADGSRFPQEHSLTAHGDGIVCVARDITERKTRERQLEALIEVARELMSADTHDDIAQIGIEAVENVLEFEVACIRLFDEDANRLAFVALTDGALELLETQMAYDLESTLAGRAFRDEEPLINATDQRGDVGSESPFENASVHVPIGRCGVLSFIVRSDEQVDDNDVHLVELLAMGIGAALERADRTRLLRTQERELRQQHNQLETLIRINAVNNEISTSLVAATVREELDRTICEHLVESEFYQSAWIGRIEGASDRFGSAIGVGVEESYLDTITNASLSGIGGGVVKRAIESQEMHVIYQYQIDGINGADEEDGEAGEDVESIAAVPLLFGDRLVGVLVINSVRDDVFCEQAVSGFESLGKVIGFAQNALKSRKLLLADSIVELEFRVADPAVFHIRLTADLDCRCEFQRGIPIENGRLITYDRIVGAEPSAVLEVAQEAAHIERARVVSDRPEGFVLETVTSHSLVQHALELGTTVRSAVADGGEGTVLIEAPHTADVRELVGAFVREFDALELVAKRERDHSVTTADEFRTAVATNLTEKQCGALEAAYLAGYYDWPRKTTAEELAESMDISSSTLHQHLRKANWNLLSAFFDEPTSTPRVE